MRRVAEAICGRPVCAVTLYATALGEGRWVDRQGRARCWDGQEHEPVAGPTTMERQEG